MSVAETRARIIIDSKNAQHSLETLAKTMESFNKSLGGQKFNNFSSGISKVNTKLNTLTKSIVTAEAGLKSLEKFGSMISTVLGGAFDYTTTLESNAVGISGILTSMAKLDGKTLEWNKALSVSRNIMSELRTTALQTASTAPELIDTFRALLGPAMGAGMNVKQVMQLTTVGVNAVKSMGLGGVQLVQELRSIIQGSIKPASSTLATALGISNADVKNAIKSSDGLFKFLMERLKGFEKSVSETSKTIKGRIDILTEALYQSIEQGSGQVFETIRNTLKDLSDKILKYNEEAKRFELSPDFIKQIEKVSDFVNFIIEKVSYIGKAFLDNLGGLTDATVFFLKWEGMIGVAGLVIKLFGKFKDLILQSSQAFMGLYEFAFKTETKQERINVIENEINNSLKERKTIAQNIDSYNNKVFKNIEKEFDVQRKITKELEKQKKIILDNYNVEAKLFQNGRFAPLHNANQMRIIGKQMNMSKTDIEEFIGKYYKEYNTYGANHANAYLTAFRNALKKYNISDDVKGLMQKNNSELSYLDFYKLASARNNTLASAGASQQQITNIQNLDKAFDSLAKTMQEAGVSQNAISQEMVRFTKDIINANGDLNKVKIHLNEQQIKEYEQNLKSQIMYEKVGRSISAVSSLLVGLGVVYQSVASENDSCLGTMAEWSIKAGTVISAIGQIGVAMKELIAIVKELNIGLLFQNLLKLGATHPYIAGALGLGALAYGGYKLYENTKGHGEKLRADYELQQKVKPYVDKYVYNDNPNAEDTVSQNNAMLKQAAEDRKNASININGLTNAFPTGGGDSDSKAQREAEKLKRLQQKAEEAKRSYESLISTIKVANDGLDTNATEFTKKQDEIDKKVLGWQNNFKKLQDSRQFTEAEINELNGLISKYRKLAEAENERNKEQSWYKNEITHIENLKTLGEITTQEANQRRAETLQNEVAFLQSQYSLYEEHSTKRIELEQQVANKIKEIRDLELTDGKIHWDNLMEHIKNTTFNQTETVKSAFDGIMNTFVNFGQNMFDESKTLSERFKDMFKDFTKQILNMLMKIIMQALIMRAITGLFNKGGGSGKGISTIGNGSNFTLGTGAWGDGVPEFAQGGVANGWSIVGEKGPELVNFSNPARVYNADQTRNALSGGASNVNIKIDLKNESGQQLQAEQTGSSFDGENWVVGIVLKAMATNKGGIRTAMKGLANA